ncbi:MAG: BlaI/MecI/CopY family transcriptional regulator [Bacteroidales bacterium]|jgi:predicted transcriptional regulator|nr:BlaI/MecI/CopY family transcriptional regulator [Bacteroidales bacterium]MDD4385556.1 BlaI/MecI/CopY family transcriptional regulator [Bacteroidales bacterium]MDY0197556.1 BlaI/MecI/CopY family transcriptional regulator [Tenuifilaceae bacterium]
MELTKAEEQIMHILWKLENAFVKDIIDELPSPKPAYNTVSTIVRILEKKGFVNYTAFGKTHQYYPIISKKDYTGTFLRGFIKSYFGNSYRQLVSFFAKEENLSVKEMEEIITLLTNKLDKKKKDGNS